MQIAAKTAAWRWDADNELCISCKYVHVQYANLLHYTFKHTELTSKACRISFKCSKVILSSSYSTIKKKKKKINVLTNLCINNIIMIIMQL